MLIVTAVTLGTVAKTIYSKEFMALSGIVETFESVAAKDYFVGLGKIDQSTKDCHVNMRT